MKPDISLATKSGHFYLLTTLPSGSQSSRKCPRWAVFTVQVAMPENNRFRRVSRFLLVALALFCSFNRSGSPQKPAHAGPEIEIFVAPTKDPNVFPVSLKNVGLRGLSLVLGGGCASSGARNHDITSVSYELINEYLVTIHFEELGRPCGGNLHLVIADLAPGECYTYDVHLDDTTLAGDQALVGTVTAGNHFYSLRALVDGEKGIHEWQWTGLTRNAKYPPWRGRATSKRIVFPSVGAVDWRTYAQNGGTVKSVTSPCRTN